MSISGCMTAALGDDVILFVSFESSPLVSQCHVSVLQLCSSVSPHLTNSTREGELHLGYDLFTTRVASRSLSLSLPLAVSKLLPFTII